jgi:hypothetical protein
MKAIKGFINVMIEEISTLTSHIPVCYIGSYDCT